MFKADPKKEFCSNPDCPDRGKRGFGNIVKYGHDKNGKQRFKCTTCFFMINSFFFKNYIFIGIF